MRPERLELHGFTAFREPVEIDFTGADLFALSGPTGAGKSSVIDAVCFALYGVVPRYGDRRLVAPVISQGRLEARVALHFSVGEAHYSAVRVVRATANGATTKEARLVRRLPDGDEVLAGTADELTEAVTRLLGLTFEHFTTCVVLPQGDFAQFLHAKPKERQKLLVELLDLGLYERMRSLARIREAAADGSRAEVEHRVAAARDLADPDALVEVEARISVLDELIERIDVDQARLDELRRVVQAETAVGVTARADAERLAAVVRPEGVGATSDAVGAARAELLAAGDAEDAAAAALEAAETACAALPSLDRLDAAATAHADLAQQRQRRSRGEILVAETSEAVEGARAAVEQADAAFRAAEETRDAAQRASLVAEVGAGLHPGDPCPVCGAPVDELPAHPDAEALIEARVHLDEARSVRDDRHRELAATAAELDRLRAKLAEVDESIARLSGALEELPSLEAVETVRAEVAAATAAVGVAKQSVKDGRARRRAAELAERTAVEAEQHARAAFDLARDTVAGLGPPSPGRADLAADWDALVAWADREQPARRQRAELADAAAAGAAAEAAALHDAVVDACRDVGVELGERVARDALVDHRAGLAAERDRRRAAAATLVALEEAHAGYVRDQQVARELARHLSATGFEKWVLDAALRHLVAGATGVLHSLSSGTYSLTLEPRTSNFCVIDHANADAVRSARTLSGGETFLASLALALALADEVAHLGAGGATRLESMFLDEGFGTLDADTLDTVAGALEDLGAQGRTVGIVTHVAELAERLPVRYSVTKTPTGAVVERIDR
ncbi:MAG: SMC family ATPase [Acidimicrobiales bacterium]|jgi:exonuclease SbcC|nr:SMC family ATPase [Acidimicrobiales bacterium]